MPRMNGSVTRADWVAGTSPAARLCARARVIGLLRWPGALSEFPAEPLALDLGCWLLRQQRLGHAAFPAAPERVLGLRSDGDVDRRDLGLLACQVIGEVRDLIAAGLAGEVRGRGVDVGPVAGAGDRDVGPVTGGVLAG